MTNNGEFSAAAARQPVELETGVRIPSPTPMIENMSNQFLPSATIKDTVAEAFVSDFVAKPSEKVLSKAVGIYKARGGDSRTWPDLQKNFPGLPWQANFDLALSLASWNLLPRKDQITIVKKQESSTIISRSTPMLSALTQLEVDSEELAQKATGLYQLVTAESQNPQLTNNSENNFLLAKSCVRAVDSGVLNLWRFVCLPDLTMESADGKFTRWNYSFSISRYDTLTPCLDRDKQLLTRFNDFGISTRITFVVDDWEALWLRVDNQYNALSASEHQSAMTSLNSLRQDMRRWIDTNLSTRNITSASLAYFSSFISYFDFITLKDQLLLESDVSYSGLLADEILFVRKALPELSLPNATRKAQGRIVQYATEGAILSATSLGDGIYLNSEYPTQSVWKKLSLIAKIPTLFYVKDKDIRNV